MICRIPFRSQGFGQSTPFPPARGTLDTTWTELLYSAITVGRASSRHVTMFGRYSLYEAIYRVMLLSANLKNRADNFLEQTDAYQALDPSEKSAVSYWMGLSLAKLFSSCFLETDFLCHLDVYRNFSDPSYKIDAEFFSGGKKPDLVGQMRSGGWIAIEAKGRTNGIDKKALDLAKNQQLKNLRTINSIAPRLKVAVQSFFSRGRCQVCLVDPESSSQEAKDLRLPEREIFIRHWYEPFLKVIDGEHQVREEGDDRFLYAEIGEVDIKLGMDLVLYKNLRDTKHSHDIREYLDSRQVRKGSNWYLGNEGIFIELGSFWNADNMSREPHLRVR
jgi:hypothetical protein